MDLLGTLTIVTVAAVAVACKGTVSAASAGLALANVFQVRVWNLRDILVIIELYVVCKNRQNLDNNNEIIWEDLRNVVKLKF